MATATPEIVVRRVYDDQGRGPAEYRVLVDRLWPRGVSRADLDADEWARDVAPSTDLRRWYGHDPARFHEFSDRYLGELADPAATRAADRLLAAAGGRLVLLTATRDVPHSAAVVLAGHLRSRAGRARP